LRDLEVDNGANAPRIHSMDDYFMIEVEKVSRNWKTTVLSNDIDLVCVIIVLIWVIWPIFS
jgi:YLP motif-containing protein 1